MTVSAKVHLRGLAPYSQSVQHETEKLNKERPDDYEKRTWRNKMHRDEEGMVVMPALSFKHCVAEAVKFLGTQIPGKGKATFTKHFEAGILVTESPRILLNGKPVHVDDVAGKWLNVPSDGVAGSGKRVKRCFPIFPMGWETTVEFLVLDDTITSEVFVDHLVQAGQLIGVGSFRVRQRGTYGRFEVCSMEWATYQSSAKNIPVTFKEIAA